MSDWKADMLALYKRRANQPFEPRYEIAFKCPHCGLSGYATGIVGECPECKTRGVDNGDAGWTGILPMQRYGQDMDSIQDSESKNPDKH